MTETSRSPSVPSALRDGDMLVGPDTVRLFRPGWIECGYSGCDWQETQGSAEEQHQALVEHTRATHVICLCGDPDCMQFAFDYPWCRPCEDHHRSPECAIDVETPWKTAWHRGPTVEDPDPGKVWCRDCKDEVWWFDGIGTCGCPDGR